MSSYRSKLDFRFADELDGIELESFISSVMKNTEQNESNPYYFRNIEPIITIEELEKDLISMPVKWLVLETPIPEEDIVGAARLTCDNTKIGRVNIICAAGCDQIHKSIMKRLLSVIETVSYNMGLHEVIIAIPEWRMDIQDILTIDCKYIEQSGYMWPEGKSNQIIKPTMVLEYHKCFIETSNTNIPNNNNIETSNTNIPNTNISSSIEYRTNDAENIFMNSSYRSSDDVLHTHDLPQLIETLFTALHKEYDDINIPCNNNILVNNIIDNIGDIPIINMENLDL